MNYALKSNAPRIQIIIVCLVLCLFYACQKPLPPVEQPPINVDVIEVKIRDVPATYEYVGVVQSSHEVEIRARTTGYLEKIEYHEGTFVHEGQVLFQLEKKPFEIALSKAKAQLAREEANHLDAKQALERYIPLYKQKAASKKDLDDATAKESTSAADVLAAKTQVDDATLNLDYATIRSPISGLPGLSNYREGSLITPENNLMTTVSVLDPIWVKFSVSEADILRSRQLIIAGKLIFPKNEEFEAHLVLADGSKYPLTGTLRFAAPTYDPKTGTLLTLATFPNPDGILRPGQFVRVQLIGAIYPDTILIPQAAVIESREGPYVFIVNDQNIVEKRAVDLGRWSGNDWIINKGLEKGEKVIIKGVKKVQAGSKVTATITTDG